MKKIENLEDLKEELGDMSVFLINNANRLDSLKLYRLQQKVNDALGYCNTLRDEESNGSYNIGGLL